MLPQNERAPQKTSPMPLGSWLLLSGVPLLWCAHAYFLWSGSLAFIFTQMALWIVTVALLFSFLAVLQGKDATYRRAQWVVGVLLVLSAVLMWSPLPNYIRDAGIRHRIDTLSDEAKLLAWAEEILRTPSDKLPIKSRYGENTLYLDGKRLPSFVRSIPIGRYQDYAYCRVDAGTKGRYLLIYLWHMRPEHWGILLCDDHFQPESLPNLWVRRWRNGLYSFQQINVID